MGKTNTLLNLVNRKLYTDRIHLYTKEPYQTKYQFLINTREGPNLKHCNGCNNFTEYLNEIWMMFMKIMKSTTQIRNVKY